MRNDLHRHEKSDFVKWIIVFVLIVVLMVGMVGVILQSFTPYKPSDWFKKDDTEQTTSTTHNEVFTVTPYTARLLSESSSRVSMEMELRETFSADNRIAEDNANGKGAKWLSENSYDAFCYTAFFYVPQVYNESYYAFFFFFFYEHDIFYVGNLAVDLYDGAGGKDRFAAFFYQDYYAENNIKVSCGDWSSGVAVFKLEITDQQMRICPSLRDSEDWGIKTKIFASNTAEYRIAKKAFLEGTLTLEQVFGFSDYYLTPYVKERIVLYENFPVKEPVPLPPNPVKDGHTFVGWYYDSALTRPYDGKPIYEDTVLYAKFQINRYTVTFDSNGGSSVSAQTVDWNTVATLTTPIRDGYAFDGWFLSDGTQYTGQVIKENITLTARWERNRFDVTFNTNGGSEVDNQQVMLNHSVTLPSTTNQGYNFVGWFLSDGTQYINQPVTDDLVLVARWEVIMCTVTFYVGDEVYTTKTVEYGTTLVKVIESAKELNLSVMSVRSAGGNIDGAEMTNAIVTDDSFEFVSEELTGIDKVINGVNQNKWQILGGVAGGVALIAVIAAIVGGTKRKKR